MATKIGITGQPNSGKSYARRTLNAKEVCILSPSVKSLHLKLDGKKLPELDVLTKAGQNCQQLAEGKLADVLAGKVKEDQVYLLLKKFKDKFESGEWKLTGHRLIVRDINKYEFLLDALSKYRSDIKIVILPDFTHFFTEIISKRSFIERKSGGEAYQRFWELAGDAARNILLSADYLRDDLLVVIEFHSIFDEATQEFKIFVPAGKMIEEKFLPDSYFDYMLYTDPLKDEDTGKVKEWRYVTEKVGRFNGRSNGIFGSTYIPNDLSIVVKKVREYEGI